MPDLRKYVGTNDLELRAFARNQGAFVDGIVSAGLGGGLAFIGGFLALAGGLSHHDGLLVAGGITAGVGLVAIGPGVYLIAGSGAKAEVSSERAVSSGRSAPSPGFGLGVSF